MRADSELFAEGDSMYDVMQRKASPVSQSAAAIFIARFVISTCSLTFLVAPLGPSPTWFAIFFQNVIESVQYRPIYTPFEQFEVWNRDTSKRSLVPTSIPTVLLYDGVHVRCMVNCTYWCGDEAEENLIWRLLNYSAIKNIESLCFYKADRIK